MRQGVARTSYWRLDEWFGHAKKAGLCVVSSFILREHQFTAHQIKSSVLIQIEPIADHVAKMIASRRAQALVCKPVFVARQVPAMSAALAPNQRAPDWKPTHSASCVHIPECAVARHSQCAQLQGL